MHDTSAHAEIRIDRFIRERLVPAVIRARAPLEVLAWDAPGEPVSFAVARDAEYRPFNVGERWGRPWGTTWFRIRGAVPSAWSDGSGHLPAATRALLQVDLGFDAGQPGFQSEGLLWTFDGVPVKGIAPRNNESAAAVAADGTIDLLLEAAANPDVGSDFTFEPTTLGDPSTAGTDPIYELKAVDVVLRDDTATALLADARALRGLMHQLPPRAPRRAAIRAALERMLEVVDPVDVVGTAAAGRSVLAAELAKPASASAHRLHAVGHAHIDSAWLWPVRETVRKTSRTFSNAIALIDDHPEFTFAVSSAQQLSWVQQHYPALFERIREKVREGRFIPVGGMWVESDTNLPGGEALVRQFVQGKRFFLEELGVDCEEVWLPDSFGYSGALPQIARLAGMRWFLTQKISWNDTNRMPHHTFQWEGIDGTRIFTHFPPVDKYNSDLDAADLSYAEQNFADAARATQSLLPYGYGDGGGGPTSEMTAIVDRTGSLEGSPRLHHSTPRAFFEAAEAEYPDPEVWVGELYLELHRGTYTSQRRTKVGNRRSEHLLREAELWATTASVRTGAPYPAALLRDLWRLVLLQQFHDILPGSAIAWVHQEAERNYDAIATQLESMIETSLAALSGVGEHTLVVNAAPHDRAGVPALGAMSVSEDRGGYSTASETPEGWVLDNGRVRAVFNRSGLLTSLVHLPSGRETVPPGTVGNLFQLHRDTPAQWDAWDIDDEYRAVVEDLVDAESVTWDASIRSLLIVRRFGRSVLQQRIRLPLAADGLDIETELDWREQQKLLKLAFPLDISAERFASEIQFGHVQRPTHTNTSWDHARYETVAHRWIHVAEPDFGVAITNDSIYGYDVTRAPREGGGSATVARLSIVRTALFPDPDQDQGHHRFRIGVLPGADVLDAVIGGYRSNIAERVVPSADVETIAPLVAIDEPGVVVEAVKLAEDGSGDVVVRMYESLGRRTRTTVRFAFDADRCVETDLLERPLGTSQTVVSVERGHADVALRPFQILTLRVPTLA